MSFYTEYFHLTIVAICEKLIERHMVQRRWFGSAVYSAYRFDVALHISLVLKLLISVQTCTSTWRDNLCNKCCSPGVTNAEKPRTVTWFVYTRGGRFGVTFWNSSSVFKRVLHVKRELAQHKSCSPGVTNAEKPRTVTWFVYTRGGRFGVTFWNSSSVFKRVLHVKRELAQHKSCSPGVTDAVKPRTWYHRCGETPHVDLICIHTRRSLWHFETPHQCSNMFFHVKRQLVQHKSCSPGVTDAVKPRTLTWFVYTRGGRFGVTFWNSSSVFKRVLHVKRELAQHKSCSPGVTDAVKPCTLTWFVYTGGFGILKLLISVQTCSSTWRDNLCNISLVHLVSPMRWNPARWPDLYTQGAVALVSHFETPHQCSNVYFTWRENLHNISLVHLVSPMRWNPAPGVTDVVKPRTWCHRCGETPHVDLICIHTRRSLWHFETPH